MKKIFLVFLVLITIIGSSCSEKRYFKEILSKKNVSISLMRNSEDQYVLNIPLEFELFLNEPSIRDTKVYWSKDGKNLELGMDFLIVNGDSHQIIFGFESCCSNHKYENYPKKIYLYDSRMTITKEEGNELIKKYNPNSLLASIQNAKDTIVLVSYERYRKDNPKFLEDMRRIPDTLTLSILLSGGKAVLDSQKINW